MIRSLYRQLTVIPFSRWLQDHVPNFSSRQSMPFLQTSQKTKVQNFSRLLITDQSISSIQEGYNLRMLRFVPLFPIFEEQLQQHSLGDEQNKMAADIINIATHEDVESLRELMTNISQTFAEDPDLVNERDEMGKSALDVAAMLGKTQMLQELKTIGADVNFETSSGSI